LLTLDFFFATFLIAVCIAGFRMLVWPLLAPLSVGARPFPILHWVAQACLHD
jgi:hypothetical protein